MLVILSRLLQIFADLKCKESSIRWSLLLKNINVSLRDVRNSTEVDEWLFSQGLGKKLESAKTPASLSDNLKPQSQTSNC